MNSSQESSYSFVAPPSKKRAVGRISPSKGSQVSKPLPARVPVTAPEMPMRPNLPKISVSADPATPYQAHQFRLHIERHLLSIGAKPPSADYPWVPWVLETRAGMLYLHVFATRVMGCFYEADRAVALIGDKSCRLENSGRWDFIFDGGEVGKAQADVFIAEIAMVRKSTMNGVAAAAGVAPAPSSPVVVGPSGKVVKTSR